MQELIDLFRHNAWANALAFAVATGLTRPMLEAEAPGTQGTVTSTLGHLARVEDAFLAMIQGRPPDSLAPREAYLAHDIGWFAGQVRDADAGYLRVLEAMAPERLDRDIQIPWFSFPLSVRQGLLQVLTHSAQHRSQVLSWLSAQGVKTPDLDYVVMLRETPTPA
jgi:uncharacterized damage-inducible protein DinB